MKLKHSWRHVGGHVYESINLVRVHVTGGLIRYKNGETFHAQQTEFYKFMTMTGDNRRRAMMFCAENISQNN
jgi:hypothetical protein